MPMAKTILLTSASAILCLGITACERPNSRVPEGLADNQKAEAGSTGKEKFSLVEKAQAKLKGTKDNTIDGLVTFMPSEGRSEMKVSINISGLTPGEHGFHIHTDPNCDNQGKAAGGHFNPQEVDHSGPRQASQHVGDLGNITANNKGDVDIEINNERLAFSGENNILNRAVVVHANADDLVSQPSGDAGGRVACGVIRSVE